MIRFTVYGKPKPQGSKRHVGNGIMVESSKGLKPWRQEIAGEAIVAVTQAQQALPMFTGHVPVEVTLRFYFTSPKKKRAGMTTAPDVDKLARSVFDSLKGILIHDDSQVIELHARKMYGGPERVEIEVREAIA